MSGLAILDLVVGMIFIYFLLSIVCSSAVELWFAICKTRARLLEQWVTKIFTEQALDSTGRPVQDANGNPVPLGRVIADHCMITALSKNGKTTAYFNAENFVSALLDKISIAPSAAGTEQAPPATLQAYIAAIIQSPVIKGEFKRTILGYANEAILATASNTANPNSTDTKSDLDRFRQKLENWYDSNAERITGTLKRTKAMPSTFFIAIVITIGMNADSVKMSRYLYENKEESKQFAAVALNTIDSYKERVERIRVMTIDSIKEPIVIKDLEDRVAKMQTDMKHFRDSLPAGFPIGWKQEMQETGKGFRGTFQDNLFKHSIGWLFTILAICLGAPFWFDLLNKVANLRGTGPKPATSEEDSKKNK